MLDTSLKKYLLEYFQTEISLTTKKKGDGEKQIGGNRQNDKQTKCMSL